MQQAEHPAPNLQLHTRLPLHLSEIQCVILRPSIAPLAAVHSHKTEQTMGTQASKTRQRSFVSADERPTNDLLKESNNSSTTNRNSARQSLRKSASTGMAKLRTSIKSNSSSNSGKKYKEGLLLRADMDLSVDPTHDFYRWVGTRSWLIVLLAHR
jgi:hypothetical protein